MLITVRTSARSRRALTGLGLTLAVGVLGACGAGTPPTMGGTDHPGMSMPPAPGSTPMPGHHGMPGMAHMSDMPTGDGLTAEANGFRFALLGTSLPAGQPAVLRFRITTADGAAVTRFEPDQTKLMHLYLIRSDLTGFQHAHPTMAADGTWTADLTPTQPGAYRAYASFTTPDATGANMAMALSRPLAVPGPAGTTPLPGPAGTTQVDGYTLTLQGRLRAGSDQPLTISVSKDGRPVRDLQPYLDTYAHLTAFHEGDLAFAHLHPQGEISGDHGGPTLRFDAMLPKPGNWRLFVQFQTSGVVHTAAITVPVG